MLYYEHNEDYSTKILARELAYDIYYMYWHYNSSEQDEDRLEKFCDELRLGLRQSYIPEYSLEPCGKSVRTYCFSRKYKSNLIEKQKRKNRKLYKQTKSKWKKVYRKDK